MQPQAPFAAAVAGPSATAGSSRTLLPSPPFLLLWTTLLCLALFLSRLLGPPDLLDDDQQRPAAYVMDVLAHGHWVVQQTQAGEVMSKPPLSTWLTALLALPFGRLSGLLLMLPGALATLALAWLIVGAASRCFGRGAALLGATGYLLSMVAFKQVALVRTDALFALFTFLGAMAAFRAWQRQSGWTLFWLAAAAATLTKGPLGLLLALGGLWAVPWERRGGTRQPLRGTQWPGVLLFLVLTLGWFCLAYRALGQPLIDRMIGRELVGHALRSDSGKPPLIEFYIPFLYFLSRFAPCSLLALLGFWRIGRHPAPAVAERQFERFLFCYFFGGLLIFSLAPHHRPEHLWPLIPAAALVAGREAARLGAPRRRPRLLGALAAAAFLFLGGANLYLHLVRTRDENVLETRRIRDLAAAIRDAVGGGFPLIHVDSPLGLHFYLGRPAANVSLERAAQALAGPEAAFVVVEHPEELKKILPAGVPRYEVLRAQPAGSSAWTVVSNHPRLEYTPRMAAFAGPVLIRMDGLHLVRAGGGELVFRARQPAGRLTLTNQAGLRQPLRVTILNARPETTRELALEPGASWSQDFGRAAAPGATLKIAQLAGCRDADAQLEALGRQNAFAGFDYLFVNGDLGGPDGWGDDVFLAQARRFGLPLYPIAGGSARPDTPPYPPGSFLDRFGYRFTAFDDGPARFILLDAGRGGPDPRQIQFLEGQLKDPPDPSVRLIFQQLAPAQPNTEASTPPLLDLAARGRVQRIYSAAFTGMQTVDYPTSFGVVRGVNASGAGHWLEIDISPGRIQEIPHELPSLSVGERVLGKLRQRGLFLATAWAPRLLAVLLLALLFVLAGRRTLSATRCATRW